MFLRISGGKGTWKGQECEVALEKNKRIPNSSLKSHKSKQKVKPIAVSVANDETDGTCTSVQYLHTLSHPQLFSFVRPNLCNGSTGSNTSTYKSHARLTIIGPFRGTLNFPLDTLHQSDLLHFSTQVEIAWSFTHLKLFHPFMSYMMIS